MVKVDLKKRLKKIREGKIKPREYPKRNAESKKKKQEQEIKEEEEEVEVEEEPEPIKEKTEEEINKEFLSQEKLEQEYEKLKGGEINWIEEEFWDSWDKVKGHWNKLIKPKQETSYELDETPRVKKWFFLAHSNDTIIGKPQLIEQVQKRILLIRLTSKIHKRTDKETKEDTSYKTPRYLFFDERYDKRYDGAMLDCFALDFWFYKIITKEGKEHYIFTQEKLPNCTCTFKGMSVLLDDFAEMSRSLKMKSLSRLFFMKEFEPDIKILSQEQLITYTKGRKITEEDWLEFLAYHPLGSYNRFPTETELLKSVWILSGKVDDWPLHLSFLGTTGTRKSMGLIETTAYKFSEEFKICEGANSRIKTLMPSFKEKPANIGYLAKQERVGFVDEIGKMVEFESTRHQSNINNILGDLNFLLDHKRRLVGSGNDNECDVQATGKFMFVSNPVSNKLTIYDHVGLIDPTTMSRFFWWVQDEAEQKFVLSEKGIIRNPPHTKSRYIHNNNIIKNMNNGKSLGGLSLCGGKIESRDEFLTLFDSCYSFCCAIDEAEIKKLIDMSINLAREPMKSSVWKPRVYHHVKLLIDGLCKHRCLFKDYDKSFIANQEDYNLAEIILIRMVNGWNTVLAPKEKTNWGGGF